MIQSIRLQNYRSYKDSAFEFEPGVNIVVGPNASGKTNLLEAVWVAYGGTSYRARDIDLVRHGAPWARLDIFAQSGARSVKLEKQDGSSRVKKSFVIGDKTYGRLKPVDRMPVILFEPEHLRLLSGSPERRREFFDDMAEQLDYEYAAVRSRYRRTLMQRNALLKKAQYAKAEDLFVWNVRLSELASIMVQKRYDLVRVLAAKIGSTYSNVAGVRTKVELRYNSHFPSESYANKLLKELERNAERDRQFGYTSVGPHRDDVEFWLNGRLAGTVASRGETRSLLLSLKLLELTLVEKASGAHVLMLLDDVFSELDGKRRKALTSAIGDHQAIITTTDADVVQKHLGGSLIALE